MGLLDSLNLGDVPADPNDIPDGPYVGEIFKDDLVVKQSDNTVHHVITYRVTEGNHNGAQRQEWYLLGNNPTRDEVTQAITGMTPAMDETKKRWYKKRLGADLGLTDEQIANWKPGTLVGTKVRFGVKTNNGFKNINFVERTDNVPAAPVAGVPTQGGTPPTTGTVQGSI